MAGQVRKQLADPDPDFTVLCKTERRPEQLAQLIFPTADRLAGKLLSVFGIQPRFRVKQIDVTRPAPHKQKDDSPRAWRKMRGWRRYLACRWPIRGAGAVSR